MSNHLQQHQTKTKTKTSEDKRHRFSINDDADIAVEILRRLDGRSLGVAACVCRLWCSIARNDSIWEDLCFRHSSSSSASAAVVRPVVKALGGYKRLYMVCVRPVMSRLARSGRVSRVVWTTRDEFQLSLSLFCVDYYERLCLGASRSNNGGDAVASSLMFLCKPVNV